MTAQSESSSSPTRVALYIRTSPIAEITESSEGPLRAYAAQRGYDVVATYRDDVASGWKRNRAGLSALVAEATPQRFDLVLVSHSSQLAADPVEAQAIIDDLQQRGIGVESLAEVSMAPPNLNAENARMPAPSGARRSSVTVDPTQLRAGMEVLGADGDLVGKVKVVRSADMLVDRPLRRDVFVPFTAIQSIAGDRIVLDTLTSQVGNQGWPKPPITGYEEPNPTSRR